MVNSAIENQDNTLRNGKSFHNNTFITKMFGFKKNTITIDKTWGYKKSSPEGFLVLRKMNSQNVPLRWTISQ